MKNLENLIQDLETKIEKHEMVKSTVSAASVGWQIEHILLTINMIVNALQNPRTTYKWSFRLPRYIVFGLNKIPRGKARAPKIVQPQQKVGLETINKQLVLTKENIKLLKTLDENLFFEHQYFGHLKVTQTIKFLEIHTKHHLKIIDDIIKA